MSESMPVSGPVKTDSVVRSTPWKRLLKNPMGIIALAILALTILAAIFAGVLAPHDPNTASISNVLAAPGGEHLLGTDSAGRDILSRLLFGSRLTLLAAAVAAITAVAIGLPAGLIAGYYGKWFDSLSNWVVNILMALPAMIVLLAFRAATGPSVWTSMVVFGVLISPSFFRLVRTAVQSVRNELYVDAARVSGLSDARIITKHVLTVVRAPIIIQASIVAGVAINIQSALEFLGLGDPVVPTWGVMVSDGFRSIYRQPISLLWPSLAITLVIAAFILLGNALRDALEDLEKVKEKKPIQEHAIIDPDKPAGGAIAEAAEVTAHDHLLQVKNLAIAYPQPGGGRKTVVEDVSLYVDRAEVLGIVGESGSGKTQTAFSVLGLLPDNAIITNGAIVFDGVSTIPAGATQPSQAIMRKLRGKRVAYIPQEPMSNLDPSFTVGSQLVRPMVKILGISKEEARTRALELLASVGIPDPQRTFKAYPHEVSGGMAQRVLIAGAISCKPDLLIADEPTTALDVTVQAEVLDVLRDLQDESGMGIMVVTHNFGVVADICDRVIVMEAGKIVEAGPVRDILRRPEHPYTRMLLSSMLEGKEPMTKLLDDAELEEV